MLKSAVWFRGPGHCSDLHDRLKPVEIHPHKLKPHGSTQEVCTGSYVSYPSYYYQITDVDLNNGGKSIYIIRGPCKYFLSTVLGCTNKARAGSKARLDTTVMSHNKS